MPRASAHCDSKRKKGIDNDGVCTIVKPGDIMVTSSGAVHSIDNKTNAPLRLVAVIVTVA